MMQLLAEEASNVGFWQDYWSTQIDPAHLMSETGFELVQLILVGLLWKRVIKPRLTRDIHKQIDEEHNIDHHDEIPPSKDIVNGPTDRWKQ